MLALVKEKSGPGNVGLKEVAEPAVGAGQVAIRVKAAGVCGSDLHILRDDIRLNLRPPVVMGHEFSGVVEEVGGGVVGLTPGDAVVAETTFRSCGRCRHCRTGCYNLCPEKELIGYVHDGCFTELCVVPVERVHPLPEGLSFREAALCEPLACCVHAVLEQTCVRPGDVAVVAGVGTIGLLCAQVARACGAEVLVSGTDADAGRFEVAAELGFTRTVNVDREDVVAAVRSATDGDGAAVFLECSGATAAVAAGIELLRRGGRFCQVGLLGAPFQVDFVQNVYKELVVTGSLGSKWSSWRTALALAESGAVALGPLAGEPLPLAAWQDAFGRFGRKQGLKQLLAP